VAAPAVGLLFPQAIVSSRYQSRLFNFLTDRAVQWGDRAAEALRHAQLAATTAVRTVLLPLWTIAEHLGMRPLLGAGIGGTQGDRARFAPGADRDREVASDAPIRATLTILEATGWPTVDRLDRAALPPSSPSSQRGDRPDADPPPPLEIVLNERELRAIAPARTTIDATVRGLASQLGSADLVLISTDNEIVGRLGEFSQRTLDRDVRKILDRLAVPSLPPASPRFLPRFPAIERKILTPVQQSIAQLDARLARWETPALSPSGFATERQFDLHRELDRPVSPANRVTQAVADWTLAVLPVSTPSPATTSGTAIVGQRWSIDPTDGWWRNAADLVRASVAASIATVTTAIVERSPAPRAPARRHPATTPTPQPATELHSKVGNRIRDWLRDRDRDARTSTDSFPVSGSPVSSSPNSPDSSTAIADPNPSTTPPTSGTPANATNTTNTAIATSSTDSLAASAPDRDRGAGLDFDPEWIDAEAESSGYVMHPLERVLCWLDRAMAAIETAIDRAISAIVRWWSQQQAS